MEQLKVELPDNVSDAITAAVFDSFRKAREASQSDNYPIYLTKKQACEYLNISNRTLNDWIEKENIPFKHIGKTYRFNRYDLDKFMATK
ncbi:MULTISPECIES: helix-turn-helix domain-containing protein [Limosilactobacillus]|uniref:helix-turn-helix domain-containing protein n=1 Tax=Limosilactobacillus TaxID=2742598 RepID=UPI002431A7CA|nr:MULTISPECIES: helix-turn-helix domain-containing protein [Limosilactobacillus]MCI6852356.1 helix-turn-helix domain-containing protein [Limosilactobacillus vaginalis]MDY4864991.1 helix-turn-helix domain-containing protein [Limosilactobacillus sp.]